jgi:hypothetical protein
MMLHQAVQRGLLGAVACVVDRGAIGAYFSPSWTAFQADRGRDFSVIVDGVSN